ncbi:MAG: DUF1501 domain-containing protein, partial [Acidobacteria bacterium ACB2]|nr:DUF1501 domain-containing protein [Acidobacteria bacterium ACB2]
MKAGIALLSVALVAAVAHWLWKLPTAFPAAPSWKLLRSAPAIWEGLLPWRSGFVPAAYQGTLFRPTGTPILDLNPPEGITRDAQRKELDLLARLNDEHLRQRPGGGELAARAASYELAYRMQAEE